jgi:hypothetical protein
LPSACKRSRLLCSRFSWRCCERARWQSLWAAAKFMVHWERPNEIPESCPRDDLEIPLDPGLDGNDANLSMEVSLCQTAHRQRPCAQSTRYDPIGRRQCARLGNVRMGR